MYIDNATDSLKPKRDTAIPPPNWFVGGHIDLAFSSEADAKAAIELAAAIGRVERSNVFRAIEELIG